MIPLNGLVSLVVTLIVVGMIFWLLTWLIDYCGVPEPFRKVAKVVIAVAAVLMIIGALLSLANGQQVQLWR